MRMNRKHAYGNGKPDYVRPEKKRTVIQKARKVKEPKEPKEPKRPKARKTRGVVITRVTGSTVGEFESEREARKFLKDAVGEGYLDFGWYIERKQPFYGFMFMWKA